MLRSWQLSAAVAKAAHTARQIGLRSGASARRPSSPAADPVAFRLAWQAATRGSILILPLYPVPLAFGPHGCGGRLCAADDELAPLVQRHTSGKHCG